MRRYSLGPLRSALLITAITAPGCLPKALDERSDPRLGRGHPDYASAVQVRFLGVGGFTIRRGEDVIVTAPLYSNPSLEDVLTDPIAPEPALIDKGLDEIADDLPDVRAILVGHAHYDHLMDVPLIWEGTRTNSPDGAVIYGGRTTRRILAGYVHSGASSGATIPHPPLSRIEALNDRIDTTLCPEPSVCVDAADQPDPPPGQPGQWVTIPNTDGRVRLMALCSKHPPQFLKEVHLWSGCVSAPRLSPPRKAADYPEGEVLAYLIDFLGADRNPEYRVYYQDAPTGAPWGYAPASVINERAVDLALLCGGNFDAVDRPEDIIDNLKAQRVIIHHWEDFFQAEDEKLTVIPGLNIDAFYEALLGKLSGDEERLHILRPDVMKVFRPEPCGRECV